MKTINIIICAGLIIGTLTGCSSGQPSQPVETTEATEASEEYSIIGKWKGKDSDNTISYEFKENGNFSGLQTNAKGEKVKEMNGTYSYSEDTITLTEKDKDPIVSQVVFENEDVMTLVTKENQAKEEEKSSDDQKEKTEEKSQDDQKAADEKKAKEDEKTTDEKKVKNDEKTESDKKSEEDQKDKTTEIRFVREVDKRTVVFVNGTDLSIKKVSVKSEKDEDFSSNLLSDKDKDEKGLFTYSFDTNLKYEIKIETKPRKSKVVTQNSKKDTEKDEKASEAKEYIIKDFSAADMNEGSLKIKNDICYVEYTSLETGEKKDTYKEPEKKEEPKPAAPAQPKENIDTSMAGTYYLQSNMNVRTGAGYDAGVITVYTAGTTVSIVGTITNPDGSIWAKLTDGTYICYRDGNGQYLGNTPPSGGGASAGTYVTLYEMNIRSGPSTSASSAGTVPAGTVFDAYRVEYGSDGSVWLVLSRTEPGLDSYICYQNSGGTYCAPY